MNEDSQRKVQSSSEDDAKTTAQVVTAIATTDQLIAEDIQEQTYSGDSPLLLIESTDDNISNSEDNSEDNNIDSNNSINTKRVSIEPNKTLTNTVPLIENTLNNSPINVDHSNKNIINEEPNRLTDVPYLSQNADEEDGDEANEEANEDLIEDLINEEYKIKKSEYLAESNTRQEQNTIVNQETSILSETIPNDIDQNKEGPTSSIEITNNSITKTESSIIPNIFLSEINIQENTSTNDGSVKLSDIIISNNLYKQDAPVITGPDADKLEIRVSNDKFSLFVKKGVNLNFENQDTLSFDLTATNIINGEYTYTKSFSVNINDINDAPTSADSESIISEGLQHQFTAEDFGFNDEDGDPIDGIVFSELPNSGSLQLRGENVVAGQTINISEIDDLIFTPSTEGLGTAELPFKVSDGSLLSSEQVLTINLAPSNIFISENSIQENINTENSSVKVADISITDDEYGEGSLVISGSDADKLEIIKEGDSFSIHLKQGVQLNYEDQNALALDLTAEDTRNNDFTFTKSFSVEITDVNDAPTVTSSELNINEGGNHQFTATDFGFFDEDGDTFTSIIITQLSEEGSLQLNNTDVTINQEISASDISNLQFTPPMNNHNAQNIHFRATEGNLASEESTLTFNINATADQPELSIGSDQQIFLSDFQATADGWLTDNNSGTLERGAEVVFGGANNGNIALEVEVAIGDINIYKVIPTETGKSYQLNFDYSPRQGAADSSIDVLWNGTTVGTLDGSSGVFSWENHSVILQGNGSDTRLEFRAADQNGIGGLLDNIELVELYATGFENHPVSVSMNSSLVDTDGSESLTLTAETIPPGATLSDGINTFTATASESTADISDWNTSTLMLTPPQYFNGDFSITYTATATEVGTASTSTKTETVDVSILAVDNQNIVGIAESQLLIHEGAQNGITFSGGIVSDTGFSSIDQWHLDHQGGALALTAETTDGLGWSSTFRLFDTDSNGVVGVEISAYNSELSMSESHSIFSLDDLPSGHYLLTVGNAGYDENEAASMLDYPNSFTGNHDYQLVISGNTDIHAMPRDPENNAQIQLQTYDNPEAEILFTVEFNSVDMALDTNYHFELFNGDSILAQGEATFPADQSSVAITATIDNETLPTITMENLLIRFDELADNGAVLDSQVFEFNKAHVPDGSEVTPEGGDGLQGIELLDLGFEAFGLSFVEQIDDTQNSLLG